jgi:hypothetical protein
VAEHFIEPIPGPRNRGFSRGISGPLDILVGGLLAYLGLALKEAWGLSTQKSEGYPLILCGTSLLLSAHEAGIITLKLPQTDWQVPSAWKDLPKPLMGFLYGLVLGSGFITRVRTSTVYVVSLWAVLCHNLALGVISGVAYGVSRGVPVLWYSLRFKNACDRDLSFDRLPRWQPIVHLLNAVLLGMTGGFWFGRSMS